VCGLGRRELPGIRHASRSAEPKPYAARCPLQLTMWACKNKSGRLDATGGGGSSSIIPPSITLLTAWCPPGRRNNKCRQEFCFIVLSCHSKSADYAATAALPLAETQQAAISGDGDEVALRRVARWRARRWVRAVPRWNCGAGVSATLQVPKGGGQHPTVAHLGDASHWLFPLAHLGMQASAAWFIWRSARPLVSRISGPFSAADRGGRDNRLDTTAPDAAWTDP
jgi:hypothetical protein